MKSFARLLFPFCFLALWPTWAGENQIWTLQNGEEAKATLIGVYSGFVFLDRGRNTTLAMPYKALSEASKTSAQKWYTDFAQARRRADHAPVAASASTLTQFLNDNLVKAENGQLAAYDFAAQKEPTFYAFYFSAHWCGPCRRFTPTLVNFYHTMKGMGRDDFELVFVSSDTSRKEMARYMEEAKMPWPALKYSKRNRSIIEQYKGNGIPCLVITDKNGKLLFHSYNNGKYLGPSKPKNQLAILLKGLEQLDTALASE